MGTKHSRPHIIGVQACGLYCNKGLKKDDEGTTFELKAVNQRWCRCPICTRERQQYELEKKRVWEKTRRRPGRSKVDIERQIALKEKADMKAGWSHCVKCGTRTPNKFGLCRNCNLSLQDVVDIDAILAWDSGPAIHRRGMGSVCRVGNNVI